MTARYTKGAPPKAIFDHLRYDPNTGLFWWIKPGLARQMGRPVGTNKEGYTIIGFQNGLYYAHRLAWYFMKRRWPKKQIDHRDRDRSNNKWKNLRLATSAEQRHNSGMRSDNTSGYKGACWAKKERRWLASIGLKGKNKFLGYYPTAKAAHAAYAIAAKKYRGEFARTA
jgi:hypothetical protein